METAKPLSSLGRQVPREAFVRRLERLRVAAGSPSHGDLAVAMSEARLARGVVPALARVGQDEVRATLDSSGASLDEEFVAELVAAMGADEAEVRGWRAECRAVLADVRIPSVSAVVRRQADGSTPVLSTGRRLRGRSKRLLTAAVFASIAANMAGAWVATSLDLPIYLNMIGTAFAALVLGPWWGALVGVSTHVLGMSSGGTETLPFAVVNVAGALVWGYGIRVWAMGRSMPRFFGLNLLVAVACAVVSLPIILYVFGGATSHAADQFGDSVVPATWPYAVDVLVNSLSSSIPDKLLSGFLALTVMESLPVGWMTRLPSTWMTRVGPRQRP